MAICNEIYLLCFPHHMTHKLQPIDVGFISPLKSYINKEITIRLVGSSHIKLKDLPYILNIAYMKIKRTDVALNSFRKTGIISLNLNVFTDDDYAPSVPSNIDLTDTVPVIVLVIILYVYLIYICILIYILITYFINYYIPLYDIY